MLSVDFGPVLAILMTLFVVVAVGHWLVRRAVKKYPLDCPRCGKPFLPA